MPGGLIIIIIAVIEQYRIMIQLRLTREITTIKHPMGCEAQLA